jgi:hypothetical protein
MHREQLGDPCRRHVGIVQHARLVGHAKEFGEMQQRARALLPADHQEMILQSVEPSEEYDAGLVETRRAFEDVARERNGRLHDAVKALDVAGRKPRETG